MDSRSSSPHTTTAPKMLTLQVLYPTRFTACL